MFSCGGCWSIAYLYQSQKQAMSISLARAVWSASSYQPLQALVQFSFLRIPPSFTQNGEQWLRASYLIALAAKLIEVSCSGLLIGAKETMI